MFGWGAVPKPEDPPELPDKTPPPEDEHERMRLWRTDRLEEIGLSYPLALELALAGVDWHAVKKQRERGMSDKQVQEIFL